VGRGRRVRGAFKLAEARIPYITTKQKGGVLDRKVFEHGPSGTALGTSDTFDDVIPAFAGMTEKLTRGDFDLEGVSFERGPFDPAAHAGRSGQRCDHPQRRDFTNRVIAVIRHINIQAVRGSDIGGMIERLIGPAVTAGRYKHLPFVRKLHQRVCAGVQNVDELLRVDRKCFRPLKLRLGLAQAVESGTRAEDNQSDGCSRQPGSPAPGNPLPLNAPMQTAYSVPLPRRIPSPASSLSSTWREGHGFQNPIRTEIT